MNRNWCWNISRSMSSNKILYTKRNEKKTLVSVNKCFKIETKYIVLVLPTT